MGENPILRALLGRTPTNDKLTLTEEIVNSEEDILVTCLQSSEDSENGFVIFRGSEETQKYSVQKKDLKMEKISDSVLSNNVQQLGSEGVLGCNRIPVSDRSIGSILGNDNFSIGDVVLKDIARQKKKLSIFECLAISNTLTDEDFLDEVMYGITHPTCQLSGGKSYLGLHVEHYNNASINYMHHGEAKEWLIISSSNYLLAIKLLQSILPNEMHGFTGICQSTLTHRDIYVPPELLKACGAKVVYQFPGDLMIVFPSAIHAVRNHGMNMAESRNYLPFEMKGCVASYKTCEHSQKLGAEPLMAQMNQLVNDMPPEMFIHESDSNKEYKIKLLHYFKKEGELEMFTDFAFQIKNFHHLPKWFRKLYPLDDNHHEMGKKGVNTKMKKPRGIVKEKRSKGSLKVKTTGAIDKNKSNVKKYKCICKYKSNYYSDLVKHMKRKHPKEKIPLNINEERCPDCRAILKDLSKHFVCKGRM